jgi:hypothetical protein
MRWFHSIGDYPKDSQITPCVAHLIRKAHGLEDSLERESQRFGTHILRVIETVIEAVYEARGGAPPDHELRASRAHDQ